MRKLSMSQCCSSDYMKGYNRAVDDAKDLLARVRVPVSMLMEDESAAKHQRECAAELWQEINGLLGDA